MFVIFFKKFTLVLDYARNKKNILNLRNEINTTQNKQGITQLCYIKTVN